jgi:hypothetical protein
MDLVFWCICYVLTSPEWQQEDSVFSWPLIYVAEKYAVKNFDQLTNFWAVN